MTRKYIANGRFLSEDPNTVVDNSLKLVGHTRMIFGHPWFATIHTFLQMSDRLTGFLRLSMGLQSQHFGKMNSL